MTEKELKKILLEKDLEIMSLSEQLQYICEGIAKIGQLVGIESPEDIEKLTVLSETPIELLVRLVSERLNLRAKDLQ